jgi:hypothetical protein
MGINVPEKYSASIFNPEDEGSNDRTTHARTVSQATHRRNKIDLSNITHFLNNYVTLLIYKTNIRTSNTHNNKNFRLLLHVSVELRHIQVVYTPIFKTHSNTINTIVSFHKQLRIYAKIQLHIYIYIFFVALRTNAGHGLLVLEVSRSHTTHHSR